jgi:hypothetical protein
MGSSTPNAIDWPDAIKTVYVLCHPQKEARRWERLLPHLLSIGVPRPRLQVSAPTWGSELSAAEIFSAYDPFLRRGSLPAFTFKSAGLTRGEISLGINFATAVRHAVERPDAADDDVVMILESDIWLRADFVPRLRDLLISANAQGSWDFISLGEGVGTRPPGAPESYFAPSRAYKPPHQWVFRCTDSMLFRVGFLRRLNQTIIPFKEIIDWELNYQMMAHRGIPLWADPPLAEQGTCKSRFLTTLPA